MGLFPGEQGPAYDVKEGLNGFERVLTGLFFLDENVDIKYASARRIPSYLASLGSEECL